MKTIFSTDVDQWDEGDQLKFYRDQFQIRHCVISGYELWNDWVVYEGELYKPQFYEQKVEEETERAMRDILRMEDGIKSLKEKYDI